MGKNIFKFFMQRNKRKRSKRVNAQEVIHEQELTDRTPIERTYNQQNSSFFGDNSNRSTRMMPIAPLLRSMPENHAATIAVIYRSELDYLSRCIVDYPECETGGHLFGFWTVQGVPVILYATGPGPNCMHGTVECAHDQHYHKAVRDTLENTIALQHIGDWHSHHQLNLNHPSSGDVRAMLAGVGNQRGMLRRHLMCIATLERSGGKTYIDAYTFHQNDIPNYSHAAWTIIEMSSPYRQLADSILKGIIIDPRTQIPNMGQLYTVNQLVTDSLNENVESKPILYWLDERVENRNILRNFIAETKQILHDKKVEAMTTEDNHVFLNIKDGGQSILFAKPFPESPPYYFNGDEIVQVETLWNTEEYSLEFCYREWLYAIVAKINGSEIIEEKTIDTLDHLSDEIKVDDKDNNTRVTSAEIGSLDQTNLHSSQYFDANMSQNLDED